MSRAPLDELLASLDEETRARWAALLEKVDAELRERGPGVISEHLEAALSHLLAIGWTLHRCYGDEATQVMGALGDAAATVEELRTVLDLIPRKPEWSQ
jgi:hypothetical protein